MKIVSGQYDIFTRSLDNFLYISFYRTVCCGSMGLGDGGLYIYLRTKEAGTSHEQFPDPFFKGDRPVGE